MDLSTAPRRYAVGLLFGAEVTEAATRTFGGPRYEENLKAPLTRTLLDDAGRWEWADDNEHLNLIAGKALADTVDFVCRRQGLALPAMDGPEPREIWPDLDQRIEGLREALLFAVEVAEGAWHPPLKMVLARWVRDRIDFLARSAEPGESVGALGFRLRRGLVVGHRYRQLVEELFGDHTWLGRPTARWWSPDLDLAAHSSFLSYGKTPVPTYVLRLREGTPRAGAGDLFVEYAAMLPASVYRFQVGHGEITWSPSGLGVDSGLDPGLGLEIGSGEIPGDLAGSPTDGELRKALRDGLRALDSGDLGPGGRI